ncbi:type I toxin-antitoxin system Hok family toxin [Escherichia coli]|nr:type I toxin-antitoxin system Hok family toxin [Escherichia coli]
MEWFAPGSFSATPAVGAALETKKALCEVHIRTGQREVAVFPAYESE